MTALVEVYVLLSSDSNSTPLGSIWSIRKETLRGLFYVALCVVVRETVKYRIFVFLHAVINHGIKG